MTALPCPALQRTGSAVLASAKSAFFFLLLFTTAAFGATDQPPFDSSDDFSPMLFAFLLIGLCVVLILVGIGIVVAAIIAISAAVLTGLGVVSSAAFIGILRRRFSSGFRALHYQLCALATLPAGIGTLWLGSHLFDAHLRLRDILIVGSLAGISSGLLLALAFDRLAGLAYRRFVSISRTTASAS